MKFLRRIPFRKTAGAKSAATPALPGVGSPDVDPSGISGLVRSVATSGTYVIKLSHGEQRFWALRFKVESG